METTLKDRAYYITPNGEHADDNIIFALDFEQRQEATHRIIGTVFAGAPDPFIVRRSTSAAGKTPNAGKDCACADRRAKRTQL